MYQFFRSNTVHGIRTRTLLTDEGLTFSLPLYPQWVHSESIASYPCTWVQDKTMRTIASVPRKGECLLIYFISTYKHKISPHSIEGYLLCKKLYKAESDTPPSSCKMAEGRKKRFSAGEVLEAIFC